MTTRELFNRWFRTHKKVPVFNEDVDVVCKANQIMTEDGKSVEDMLKEGSGGSGNGLFKLSLYGPGDEVDGSIIHHIVEGVDEDYINIVLKSQVDAIVAAPLGSIVVICRSWINGEGNFVDNRILGLGITMAPESSSYDCELSCVSLSQDVLLNSNVSIEQANRRLFWHSVK